MPTPQRLPIVNSDDGVWGDIIRQYLEKEHFNDDTDNPINGGHQKITIQPGTAAAGTAPLKFSCGTLLTTPEAGAVEFNTDTLYVTQTTGTTRKKIAAYDDTSGATGDIYYRNSSGYFTRLGVGGTGDMLTVTGGLPSWSSTIANTSTITIKDTNFTLQDDGDTTKQLKFELSGISASTTRTLTVPDANTTLVGTDATQTLTNKTLTSPRIGTSLLDTNGNTMVSFTPTASAVVYLDIKNQAGGGAGTGPFLSPAGPNASHSVYIQAKGNNNTTSYIALGNSGYHAFKVMNTVTAGGNLLAVLPANVGGTPALTSAYSYSADANVGLDLQTKGTGKVQANGVEVATISGTQTLTNKTLTAPVVDGAVVVPQGTTITKYNTADQVTNYEKLTEYWSANVYFIETSSGGTGIKRDIKINSGGQYIQLSAVGGTKMTTFASSSIAGAKGFDATGSFQASSSIQTALAVSPTIAQSATAGYTALGINVTESTTGSGTKLLADFQVGGTSKTRIDSTGNYYISSAATNGLTFYNTADETTNYEKVSIRYNSNVAEIGGYVAGTGVHRDLRIGINNSTYNPTNLYSYAQFSVSSTRIALRWATSASGLKMVSIGGGTDSLASASTIQNVLAIEPTVNQSGTAGYTGLLINPTETATGSGTKLLIDAQVGGVSKFTVDNTGVVTMAAVGTGAGSVVTTDGTQTLTNKTLTSPKIATLYDNNGAIWLSVTPIASAVNYVSVINAATGGQPYVTAVGADTDINLSLRPKGTGSTIIRSGIDSASIALFAGVTSAVNRIDITNSATGLAPTISAAGSDTNVTLKLTSKGVYPVVLMSNSSNSLVAYSATGAVNYLQIDAKATGTAPILSAVGGDTNIGLNIVSKGTGTVQANGVDVVTTTGTQTLTNKTLTNPKIQNLYNPAQNTLVLQLNSSVSAVNYLALSASAAGASPTLGATGTDANIGLNFAPKGTGKFAFYVETGQTPAIQANGVDANHNLNLISKGTGKVQANGVEITTISGTQTLTNKTIDGASNTITNLPASATPQVSRFRISSTNPTANGYWTKIMEFDTSGAFAACITILKVFSGVQANGSSATIRFGATTQDGVGPYLTIMDMTGPTGYMSVDMFKAVRNGTDGPMELWMKGLSSVATYEVWELAKYYPDSRVTWYNGSSWQASAPTGTDYDVQTSEVWVSSSNAIIGNRASSGTTTPINLSLGGTYGTNTVGTYGNLKLRVFDDGTYYSGLGFSASRMEYQVSPNNYHSFYIGGTERLTISSSYVRIAGVDVVTTTDTQTLTNKTLTAPIISSVKGASGAAIFNFNDNAGAVNYFAAAPQVTGGSPILYSTGSDTNVSMSLRPKGTGHVVLSGDGSQTSMVLRAGSAATDVSLNLVSQNAGTVQANGVEVATISGTQTLTNKTLTNPKTNAIFDTAGGVAMSVTATGGTNYLALTNSTGNPGFTVSSVNTDQSMFVAPKGAGTFRIYVASGQTPTLTGAGADTNHNLNLQSQGTGTVKANGVDVVTTTGTQTLTNKTISGASNTLSNIPQSAVTGLANDVNRITEKWRSGTNILPNQSFENTNVWLGSSAQATYSTEQARSGAYSMKLTGNGTSFYPALSATTSAAYRYFVTPGKIYYVEMWVYGHASNTLSTGSETVSIGIWCYDNSGTYVSAPRISTSANAIGTGSWVKVSGFVTIPANSVTGQPLVYATSIITTGNIYYVDDVVMYESSPIVSDILDVNGNKSMHVYSTANAVNYFYMINKGSGASPTISVEGADTNITLNLQSKGTGTVMVNGWTAATLSKTETLTNKTLTSPTITGTVTATTLADAATPHASVGKFSYNPVPGYPSIWDNFNPALNNELAFNILRGGTITVTKNATPLTDGVDFNSSRWFTPGGLWSGLSWSSSSDVFVITIGFASTIDWLPVMGLVMGNGYRARDVMIEGYWSSGWNTVLNTTNATEGMIWGKASNGGNAVSQMRITLTNMTGASPIRLGGIFAVNTINSYGPSVGYVQRDGGNLYGTNATPPALTAAGGDANIDLKLNSKGSGVVKANNVEVATISGTQTLTNKTLTNPKIETIRDNNNAANISLVPASSRVYISPNGKSVAEFVNSTTPTEVLRFFSKDANGPEINSYSYANPDSNLYLTTKGAGTVQANGLEVATISGTQTLTNKTISGSSNTITNIPYTAMGSGVARLVHFSLPGAAGAEDGANTWTKVMTITPGTTPNVNTGIILSVLGQYKAGEDSAIISLQVAVNSTDANPSLAVNYIAKGGSGPTFAADSFKLISNGWNTNIELWVKKATSYSGIRIYELNIAQSSYMTVTYHQNSPWQSATPTGTVEATSNGVTAFGVPVVTTTGTQTLTNKTLTSPTISGTTNIGDGTTAVNLNLNATSYNGFMANIYSNTASAYTLLTRYRGTAASPTQVTSGSILGSLGFRGANDSGVANNYDAARISAIANQDFTSSAQGTYLTFVTTPDGSLSTAERMRIKADGDVLVISPGTGTTSVVTAGATQTLTNKTLTTPKIDTIKDTNGVNAISIGAAASAVNYFSLYNAATGGAIALGAAGSDTNIGISLRPAGSGTVDIMVPTGQTPTLEAKGADTNHNLNLKSKGTGTVQANGNPVLSSVTAVPAVTGTPSSSTYLRGDGTWATPAGGSGGSSGMLAPVQGMTLGDETFTISSGTVTQISGTTINGYSPAIGDRILIANAPATTGTGSSYSMTSQPTNGIYDVTGNTTNLTVSRSSDMSGSVKPGGLGVYVENANWPGSKTVFYVDTPNDLSAFTWGTTTLQFAWGGGTSGRFKQIWVDNNSEAFNLWNGTGWTKFAAGTNAGTQTLTMPATATSDTLVGRASTDTLTNKTLTSPKINQILDTTNGTAALVLNADASAVNYFQVSGKPAGNPVYVSARGADADISLYVQAKGTGKVILNNDAGLGFSATAVASSVNRIEASGSATGNAPSLSALGSDTNIGINIVPKGTGTVQANGNPVLSSVTAVPAVTGTPSASTYLRGDGTWATPAGGSSGETVTTSSATSLTLTTANTMYVFTGSSATTWTLPAVSGNTGTKLIVSNRGSANITLQRAGSDNLYLDATATSIVIGPGGSRVVVNDGTYWVVTSTVGLTDANFKLQDEGDTTKQAIFDVSGITTGTTRTYTMPNASASIPAKHTATIGDGSSTSIAVTHNLNTKDVTWSVRDASTDEFVDCDVTSTSTTQITFGFATAPASNSLKVVIIG